MNLATATVRLRPDTRYFKSEADADLKRSTPNDVKARVTADTLAAQTAVNQLKVRLDQLSAATTTAKVKLDDGRAKDQLTNIEIALKRVGLTTARPKVDLDGVARANLQLDALQVRVDSINRGGGRGGFFSGLAGLPAPGFKALGIGAAIPAAVPIAGVAAGLGASFLTPSVAGVVGLGAFGIGAKSSIQQVTKDVDQLAKIRQKIANTPATTTTISARGVITTKDNAAYLRLLKQESDLLKTMDPAQRQAAKNVTALDTAWTHYKKALEPQSFKALGEGAKIGTTGLGLLLPVAKATGDEIVKLEVRAEKALGSPFWKQFFGTFLAKEAPRAIDALGTTLGHFGDGLAHLTEDFAPLGHDLEGAMVRIGGRFDTWTQGAGPGRFVAFVDKEAPNVKEFFSAVINGVEGLSKGLAPIGQLELQILAPVANFIGDLGKTHPEVLTAIGIGLLTVGTGLKVIKGVGQLGELATGVRNLNNFGKAAVGVSGAIGAFGIGYASGGHGGTGLATATLGGALSGLVVGLSVGGPFGAAIGAAGGALIGLAGDLVSTASKADAANKAMQGWMQTALQADKFKIGQQFTQGVTDFLAGKPDVASILANAGVTTKQITSSVRGENAIGGPAGLQLQAAFRAGLISQQDFIKGEKALQTLVDNFGKVAANIDNLAKISGQASQHINDLVANANATIKLIFAQPTGNKPAPKLPTLGSLLIPPIPGRAHRAGGGPVLAGVPYTVGELGSETFVPTVNGSILPHTQTAALNKQPWSAAGYSLAQSFVAALGTPNVKTTWARAVQDVTINLSAAQAKLAADIATRTSTAAQVTSSLSGAFGLGGAIGPYGNVLNLSTYLGGGRSTLRKEDLLLRQLDRKHLSPELLAQIAQLSPQQGVALATNILSGASGRISTLDRLQSDIDRYAGFAGTITGNAGYAQTIAHDRAALAEAQRTNQLLADLIKEYRKNPQALVSAFDAALRAGQVHHR